jgi:hypothetical protein
MTIITAFNSVADIKDPNEKLQCLNYYGLKDDKRAAIIQTAKTIFGENAVGENPTFRQLYDLQVRRGFKEKFFRLFGPDKVSAYRKATAPLLPKDRGTEAFSKLYSYLKDLPPQDKETLESLSENLWSYNPRLYEQKGTLFSKIAALFSSSTPSFLANEDFKKVARNLHITLDTRLYHLRNPIQGYQTPARQVAECRTLIEDLSENHPIRKAFEEVNQKQAPSAILAQFKANLQRALTPAAPDVNLQQPVDEFLKEEDYFVGMMKLRNWCISQASAGKKGKAVGAEDMLPVWHKLMKYHQGDTDFIYTLLTTALDPRDPYLDPVTYTRRTLISLLNVEE